MTVDRFSDATVKLFAEQVNILENVKSLKIWDEYLIATFNCSDMDDEQEEEAD